MKSCLLDSNFSVIEFVRNKRSVPSLIKPFLALRVWHEDKCVYWNVSVALKCVWTSSILFDAKRGPLKTSVSKKRAPSDDISLVNLIVVWNLLAKSMKLSISFLLEVHTEKMSSMKLFQMIGLRGLERSSFFSTCAMKRTEKASAIFVPIAIPRVCRKCLPLN